ncbi:MAG: sodium:solute symporter family transporter [Hyphomicrobiaceae bacterium]
MSLTPSRHLVNPLLGVYFGIFSSLLVGIVLMALMLEQLGLEDWLLRALIAGGLVALLAGLAVATRTNAMFELLFAGRRVPAVFTGLTLSVTLLGGTTLAALPGLFYLIGFDALFLTVGMTTGLVVFAILIAPYIRKFGAYSVPAYLGLRFASPLLRVVAAAIASVPLLLLIVAELKVALMAGSWLTGASPLALGIALSLLLALVLVSGGLRSLSWTSAAQAIVMLLAVLVPVVIVAILMQHLPVPQLSHGRVTRTLLRAEILQNIPNAFADTFAFDLPGAGFEAATRRFATPYSNIGLGAFLLSVLAVMAGVAGQPTLISRITATPGVYATRKSVAWAICLVGLVFLTMSAAGVFLREIVVTGVAGLPAGQLPGWVPGLIAREWAAIDTGTARLAMSSFAIRRDAALLVLAVANEVPTALIYTTIAGLLAAALAAAAAGLSTLGTILAEDIVNGPRSELAADGVRRTVLRLVFVALTLVGGWVALVTPGDPLELLMWSLALSGSTLFPVLLISIWWKRCNGWGATMGLLVGFGVAVIGILSGDLAHGLAGPMAAALGAPAAMIAVGVGSLLTPPPGRHVLELVRDLRIPGGDTLYDREVRQTLVERRRHVVG